MQMRCERRGQCEVGIITHEGGIYAAFGASVQGHNITAYTGLHEGRMALKTWCGRVILSCRCEVVREYNDGSLALVYRLTGGRFVVGYALGDDGTHFRGELLVDCDDERARHEAVALAEYWSTTDAEDDADPWHGEPEEVDSDVW